MKRVDVILVYKKKDKFDKTNYRVVHVLPNISKIYENIIYNQLHDYFNDILFLNQCEFRKGYSYQHIVLVIPKKNSKN